MPQGSGPQTVVDNYIVTISPPPLLPSEVNALPNSPLALNVTLEYNTTYNATITAENCAGESETFVYPNTIEYGEYVYVMPRQKVLIFQNHCS